MNDLPKLRYTEMELAESMRLSSHMDIYPHRPKISVNTHTKPNNSAGAGGQVATEERNNDAIKPTSPGNSKAENDDTHPAKWKKEMSL